MSWLTWAVFAILVAVGLAYVAPGAVQSTLTWFVRLKYAILSVAGILVAFYLLTTGNTLLMLIGFVGLVIAVWQVMFNDPFGWLRPFLPV